MLAADLNRLITQIRSRKRPEVPLIVGIDGMGCSGKTTLSERIAKKLREVGEEVQEVSLDDFCNERKTRYRSDEPDDLQVYKYNFNESLFLENILKAAAVKRCLNFSFTALDAPTDKFCNEREYTLTKKGFLIVEGIHLYKAIFRNHFHYKIFVNISYNEQMRRATKRDLERGNSLEDINYKYIKRYRPSFEHYLITDRPKSDADLIVHNESSAQPLLEFRTSKVEPNDKELRILTKQFELASLQMEREVELAHKRISWALTFNGFLFTSIAIALRPSPNPTINNDLVDVLFIVIPIAGVFSAIFTRIGINASKATRERIKNYWNFKIKKYDFYHDSKDTINLYFPPFYSTEETSSRGRKGLDGIVKALIIIWIVIFIAINIISIPDLFIFLKEVVCSLGFGSFSH